MLKLSKPQVLLHKRWMDEETIVYYLHSVTYFDNTIYLPDGNGPLSSEPDNDGVFHIELHVREDTEIEPLNYLTPVVHTVSLGSVPFDEENSKIKIQVMVDGRPAGKTIVDEIDAEEDGKPGNEG